MARNCKLYTANGNFGRHGFFFRRGRSDLWLTWTSLALLMFHKDCQHSTVYWGEACTEHIASADRWTKPAYDWSCKAPSTIA